MDGGLLIWEDRVYEKNLKGAVEALKQLRNNLFHGNKCVIGGGFEENVRNRELLRLGLILIRELKQILNDDITRRP